MFVIPFSIILQFLSLCSLSTVALIVIPSIFGADLGIRHVYIKILIKVFKWGTATLDEKPNIDEHSQTSSEDPAIICKENPIANLANLIESGSEQHKKFEMPDVVYLIKSGIEAVIDDEVTKRFRAEELSSWNLLTRTNVQHEFISIRLSVLYFVGVALRYCILLPMRLFITTFAMAWLIFTMIPLAYTGDSSLKRKIAYYVNLVSFRIICRGFTAVVTYHDRENMPKNSGICVANHTTVLDAALLMQDRPYAILGQIHGGYLGWVMRMMSRVTKHVWFERSEAGDRKFVSKRITEHVSDGNNYPVLLFPEGTCINNTSVMMFKKGSFEIPTTIYPVAIKYNPWFGDAFWNSSKHSMIQYLLVVMTSWAIVADVWYLPPMRKKENESAMEFAGRVKAVIAKRGGLVDCVWDGQLKRMHVKESYLEDRRKKLGELFAADEAIRVDKRSSESPEADDCSSVDKKAEGNRNEITENGYLETNKTTPDRSSMQAEKLTSTNLAETLTSSDQVETFVSSTSDTEFKNEFKSSIKTKVFVKETDSSARHPDSTSSQSEVLSLDTAPVELENHENLAPLLNSTIVSSEAETYAKEFKIEDHTDVALITQSFSNDPGISTNQAKLPPAEPTVISKQSDSIAQQSSTFQKESAVLNDADSFSTKCSDDFPNKTENLPSISDVSLSNSTVSQSGGIVEILPQEQCSKNTIGEKEKLDSEIVPSHKTSEKIALTQQDVHISDCHVENLVEKIVPNGNS